MFSPNRVFLPLPSIYLFYCSFIWLCAIFRSSSTVFSRKSESKNHCLDPYISMMLAVGFLQILFIRLRKFLLIPSFHSFVVCFVFKHEQVLRFAKYVLLIYWDDKVFLFSLLIWYIKLIHFSVLNPCCTSGISILVMMYYPCIYCKIEFVTCFWGFPKSSLEILSLFFVSDHHTLN